MKGQDQNIFTKSRENHFFQFYIFDKSFGLFWLILDQNFYFWLKSHHYSFQTTKI